MIHMKRDFDDLIRASDFKERQLSVVIYRKDLIALTFMSLSVGFGSSAISVMFQSGKFTLTGNGLILSVLCIVYGVMALFLAHEGSEATREHREFISDVVSLLLCDDVKEKKRFATKLVRRLSEE